MTTTFCYYAIDQCAADDPTKLEQKRILECVCVYVRSQYKVINITRVHWQVNNIYIHIRRGTYIGISSVHKYAHTCRQVYLIRA